MDDAERVQVAHLGAGVGARLRRRLGASAVAGRYERLELALICRREVKLSFLTNKHQTRKENVVF